MAGPHPPISVCVINHQGAGVLDETLDAVEALEAPTAEILVVDNASTDGSAERAAARDGVQVVRLPENRGPGAARNAGLARCSGRLVLFLDNDVAPEPDAAGRLAREILAGRATIAAPCIVFADDPATIQYEGARAHFIGLMAFERAGRSVPADADPPRDLQSLPTACFLLDRDRWGDGPPFDELIFYLFEDHDLGLRARIGGHRILAVPAARCRHRGGTPGLSLRLVRRYTDVRVVNLFRNRWLILAKDYALRTLVALSPVLIVFECFQLAGAIRKGWLRQWLGAVGWVLRHRGAILRGRRAVQGSRRVRDAEILSGGPLPFADRLLEGRLEAAAGRTLDRFANGWWRLARRWI